MACEVNAVLPGSRALAHGMKNGRGIRRGRSYRNVTFVAAGGAECSVYVIHSRLVPNEERSVGRHPYQHKTWLKGPTALLLLRTLLMNGHASPTGYIPLQNFDEILVE
jgi:hypothetical protein